MELSIYLAKIFGIIALVVGIGIVFNREYYRKMVLKLLKNPEELYLGGFLALALGAILVMAHNYWVWDWTVLVTLIAWGSILKGVLLLVFPKTIKHFECLYKSDTLMGAWGGLLVVMGLVFVYFGFVL